MVYTKIRHLYLLVLLFALKLKSFIFNELA